VGGHRYARCVAGARGTAACWMHVADLLTPCFCTPTSHIPTLCVVCVCVCMLVYVCMRMCVYPLERIKFLCLSSIPPQATPDVPARGMHTRKRVTCTRKFVLVGYTHHNLPLTLTRPMRPHGTRRCESHLRSLSKKCSACCTRSSRFEHFHVLSGVLWNSEFLCCCGWM
jgi:hypothetical protein